jgi:hypothetical protein
MTDDKSPTVVVEPQRGVVSVATGALRPKRPCRVNDGRARFGFNA